MKPESFVISKEMEVMLSLISICSFDQALISKREYFLVNLLSELNANHLSLFENNIKNSNIGKYWKGRGHVSTYVAATPKCEWHF